MEFTDFEARLADVRSSPSVAGLPAEMQMFEFIAATEEQLFAVETALGVKLPVQYREFMKRYGGGQFLFVDLLPAVSGEDREDLISVSESTPSAFVAVAPVGTGDWWGFQVNDGACADAVDFWFHDDNAFEPANSDFLEFLVQKGLQR
ncbi:SMI1/KNR4 family protein [Kribbella endophytica]